MAGDETINQALLLAAVAARYPEKTHYLGGVFNDTTNSYKLVWFLAILSLLRRGDRGSFRFAELFTEVAVTAWHSVCLYRLSFGRQDKLQDAVHDIMQSSGLAPNATPDGWPLTLGRL
jgi:threonine/homoserine/homoserine lactone efflux protein